MQDSAGSVSVSENDTGVASRSEIGNDFTGSYSATTSGSDSYSVTETDSSSSGYTFSQIGKDSLNGSESGNQILATYSKTQSGTDTYTLTENGTNSVGAFNENVTGSETVSQTETGNTAAQTFHRTDSATGSYTLTDSGHGATQTPGSGSYIYGLQETGDDKAGTRSQTETGNDRYALLQGSANVADTNGQPGHLDYSPFGDPFTDPAPDEKQTAKPESWGSWLNRMIFGTSDPVLMSAHVYAGGVPGYTKPPGAIDALNVAVAGPVAAARGIDESITTPPKDPDGPGAYLQGVGAGVYDFGKGSVEGIAAIPELLTRFPEIATKLQDTLQEVRRGLSEADLTALKAVDPDLYELLSLNKYEHLTAWERGRLTARVTLKYATIVEGGVEAGKLTVRFGKKVLDVSGGVGKKIAETLRANRGVEIGAPRVRRPVGAEIQEFDPAFDARVREIDAQNPVRGDASPYSPSKAPKAAYAFEKQGISYTSEVTKGTNGETIIEHFVTQNGQRQSIGLSTISKQGTLSNAFEVPEQLQKLGISQRAYAEASSVGFNSLETSFNAGPKSVNFNEFKAVYDPAKNNAVEALLQTPAGKVASRDFGLRPDLATIKIADGNVSAKWIRVD